MNGGPGILIFGDLDAQADVSTKYPENGCSQLRVLNGIMSWMCELYNYTLGLNDGLF